MTEVIRVLGQKVKDENWRPRRTIIFASWGAEEYGLMGSREFVEDFVAKLGHRAVVYLNNDICTGKAFRLRIRTSSDLLKNFRVKSEFLLESTSTQFWTNILTQKSSIREPGFELATF